MFCDSRSLADKPRDTWKTLFQSQSSLSEVITMQSYFKLIQWSGISVRKVKEIDLQLKNMWILWINVISTLVADIMVLSILLEIQQRILSLLMSNRIPSLKQKVNKIIKACALMKWVRKYFTVSQMIHHMQGNKPQTPCLSKSLLVCFQITACSSSSILRLCSFSDEQNPS